MQLHRLAPDVVRCSDAYREVRKVTNAHSHALKRTVAAGKEVQHELQALVGSARAAALGGRLLDDVHTIAHHVAHDEQEPAARPQGAAASAYALTLAWAKRVHCAMPSGLQQPPGQSYFRVQL